MKKLLALMLIASLAACNSVSDAKNARGTGTVKTYAKPYATVWKAVDNAVKESELKIISANEATGEIYAEKGTSALSWGENVAVYVAKNDAKSTSVEVISKRSLETNLFAENWETTLFKQIDAALQ